MMKNNIILNEGYSKAKLIFDKASGNKILVNKKYLISYIKNGNTKRKENNRENSRENNKTIIKISGKL